MAKNNNTRPIEAKQPPAGQELAPKDGGTAMQNLFANTRRLCLVLIALSLVAYGNTLVNGYTVDDLAMIEKNTIVQQGFAGIPELMVTPRLAGFDRNIVNENYRPLSLVVFAMEYQLFGANPTMGHLFNILFFAACVVMLFLFILRLWPGQKGLAFTASALFALHPIHTEVVANIKSRDELMSFFFAFASLMVFMGYVREGRPWKLMAGALLLLLAYLSKETVISFLFVVPVLFYGYLNERKTRSHFVFGATVLVSAVFVAARYFVLKGHDSTAVPFLDNPLVSAPLFAERIPTAIMVLGMYLKLLFVPWPLISDYSYSSIPFSGWGNAWVWLSLVAYLAICAVAIYGFVRKQRGPVVFGILFMLANLALFSNIFFLVYSEMAERLVFFASAGFCIVTAALLMALFSLAGDRRAGNTIPAKLWLVLAPVSVVFAVVTINRNAEWKSNLSLFSADVARAPGNARLWHSLGSVLVMSEAAEATDSVAKRRLVDEGITDVQRSLAIYPGNYKAHQDIGNYFRGLGQYDSAEYHLKEAVRIMPGSATLVSDLGFVYFCEGKYNEALGLAKNAMAKDEKNPTIWFNVAMIFMQMKAYDSATAYFQRTLRLDPGNKTASDYIAALKTVMEKADSTGRK